MSAEEFPGIPVVAVEALRLAARIKEQHPDPATREEAQDALVHLAEFLREHTTDEALRARLVLRVGSLWRGDWSGMDFDGRTGQRWLQDAVGGDHDTLVALDAELKEMEGRFG